MAEKFSMNVKYLGYSRTAGTIIGWYEIGGVTYGATSDGKILDSDGEPLVNDSNARCAIERFLAAKPLLDPHKPLSRRNVMSDSNKSAVDYSRVPEGFSAVVGWHGGKWAALVAPSDWIFWQQWSTISAYSVLADTPSEAFEKALENRLEYGRDKPST